MKSVILTLINTLINIEITNKIRPKKVTNATK